MSGVGRLYSVDRQRSNRIDAQLVHSCFGHERYWLHHTHGLISLQILIAKTLPPIAGGYIGFLGRRLSAFVGGGFSAACD
jgi:hypothetical protein